MKRHWYRIENKAETPTVADIYIYDAIGQSFWDDNTVTAKRFIEDLQALPSEVETIRVHVNSPGGDVFDAVAITNALRAQRDEKQRRVEMDVEGLAASAASFVLMAGDVIRIADNALVMVHNPWSIAIGDAQAMLDAAAMLEKVRGTIIATYRWKSALSVEDLGALMDAETWMDADEAIEKGFATEKVEGLRAAASIEGKALERLKVPARFQERVAALRKGAEQAPPAKPQAAEAADVLRLCREANCLEAAEGFITSGATLEQVQSGIAELVQARTVAEARARQIGVLCESARLPELAAGYINGAMSVEAVRAHLTIVTAKLDTIEIDGSLSPDGGGKRTKPVIDTVAVYAERNRLTSKKE